MEMEKVQTIAKTGSMVVVTILTYVLGGWDMWLKTLIYFTVFDYVTGLLKAYKHKEISSDVALWGGLKKLLIYMMVAMGSLLDQLLPVDSVVLRTMVIGYYIGVEGISITENAVSIGIALPKKLVDSLKQLAKYGDGTEDNKDETNNSE